MSSHHRRSLPFLRCNYQNFNRMIIYLNNLVNSFELSRFLEIWICSRKLLSTISFPPKEFDSPKNNSFKTFSRIEEILKVQNKFEQKKLPRWFWSSYKNIFPTVNALEQIYTRKVFRTEARSRLSSSNSKSANPGMGINRKRVYFFRSRFKET